LSEKRAIGRYLSTVKWPSATDFTGQLFVIRHSIAVNRYFYTPGADLDLYQRVDIISGLKKRLVEFWLD